MRGTGSDVVEKFFRTSESAVLFPEYVARSVRQGWRREHPALHHRQRDKINGMDYRSIYSVPSEDDKSLRRVEEGAAIPQTEIKTQENLVKLHKRGRMLVASYEAIRFQRLDLFSVMLRQIGKQIMRMHLDDAINVLINGDGNNNAAEILTVGAQPIGGTAGKLTYSELELLEPFRPLQHEHPPGGKLRHAQILGCEEFKKPDGAELPGYRELTNPLGQSY